MRGCRFLPLVSLSLRFLSLLPHTFGFLYHYTPGLGRGDRPGWMGAAGAALPCELWTG